MHHYPLNNLIKQSDYSLTLEEKRYASHEYTHLDFLIFNNITKLPILAIEVDGYAFHKKGRNQEIRDTMKDAILKKLGLPIIRFKTNGSQEKERLTEKLKEILSR